MAAEAKKEEAKVEKPKAHEYTFGEKAGDFFADTMRNAAAFANVSGSAKMGQAFEWSLRASKDPSKFLFDKLSESKEFSTPEGKAKLDTIRNDKAFTDALNNAIKKDPSVASGLVRSMGDKNGAMNPSQLMDALQNPEGRKTYTQVLNVIADKKEYGFNYAEDIADSLQKKDYKQAKAYLAENNIENAQLNMASGGIQGIFTMLLECFRNGDFGPLFDMLPGMLGLQGDRAVAFNELTSPIRTLANISVSNPEGNEKLINGAQHVGDLVKRVAGSDSSTTLAGGAGNDTIGAEGNVKTSVRPTGAFTQAANDDIHSANDSPAPNVGPTAAELAAREQTASLARAAFTPGVM